MLEGGGWRTRDWGIWRERRRTATRTATQVGVALPGCERRRHRGRVGKDTGACGESADRTESGGVSLLFVPQKPGCCCRLAKDAKKNECRRENRPFSEENIQNTFLHDIKKFYVHIWNYMHIYFPKIVPSKGAHLVILFTIANVIKQLEIGKSAKSYWGRKMKGEQSDKVKSK